MSPADPEHVAGCLQRPTAVVTPTVAAITPKAGPQSGGTVVLITGSHFLVGAGVRFGTTASSSVSVLSDTVLVARSPPHAGGTADVTVSYLGHTSAVVPDARFTYARPGSQPYVTTAYLDLLGRSTDGEPPRRPGRATSTMAGAAPRSSAPSPGHPSTSRSSSPGLYQTILGRATQRLPPAHWLQLVTTGKMTIAQVATTFYASSEYLAHGGGGSTSSWVVSLYQRLLFRTPPASSVAYWSERARASGRARVATELYQSGEARRDRVNSVYLALLHRLPDRQDESGLGERTILHDGDDALVRHLAESDEYVRLSVTRNP